MTTLVTILTPGFADWETALLNAGARDYYQLDTRFGRRAANLSRQLAGSRCCRIWR